MTEEEAKIVTHSGAELEAAIKRIEACLGSPRPPATADIEIVLKGARLCRDLMLWLKAKKEGFQ